jgi:hypothetical protein
LAEWYWTSKPESDDLNFRRKTLKGCEAVLRHYQGFARGSDLHVIAEIVKVLGDVIALAEIDFILHDEFSSSKQMAKDLEHPQVLQQDIHACRGCREHAIVCHVLRDHAAKHVHVFLSNVFCKFDGRKGSGGHLHE